MPDIPDKQTRACCIAAMNGDHSAAVAILKLFDQDELVREIKNGRPFSNRVRRAIDSFCGGCGTLGTESEWEIRQPDGGIVNLLWADPPKQTGGEPVSPKNFEE